ncbi:MAG: putative O-glycosylation ligase, exosortase A system-associated [Proteobacteria bacterium]|nr:putative O-glycosylation ligase, exosortase A system-associated [Pseudomonadota bacterium]MBU4037389.1 putative O-glycosylation ligase, exosortase A system-associated [Pseudomonadota bacterium]
MPIRDTVIFILFFASLFLSLRNPVHGVILYALVSYLNPHRLTWGPAYNLQMALGIAVCTIVGIVFYKGEKKLVVTNVLICMLLLWGWASMGWFNSLNPIEYVVEWKRFTKIILMTVITVVLIKNKKDLRYLYLVIIFSIGFYDIKGVIWFLKGGTGMLAGPENSFFEGNNGLGMAINMVWPLFLMMARIEKNKWIRRALLVFFFVTPLGIIAGDSRASALTLVATAFFLIMQEKKKFYYLTASLIIIIATIPFVPETWYQRMETIGNYTADRSAMGRINAWQACWNIAKDNPLVGGGFRAMTPETFYRYAPNPEDFHDAHSIYFESLGETGFPGFFLFLCLLGSTSVSLIRTSRQSKQLQDGVFLNNLAKGTLLGLAGYMVNGAFVGMAFFDLLYQYVGLSISLKIILEKEKSNASLNEKIAIAS